MSTDLIARLRDTNTPHHRDTLHREAADALTAQAATIAAQAHELAECMHATLAASEQIDQLEIQVYEQARELAALRLTADNAEGMAGCMVLFRDDMIQAGVITDATPPMFMTEAVWSALGALRADATVAKCQVDSLRDALRKVLDTRSQEAKANLSFQNARDNFSSHWPEQVAHERAMLAACDAEREARTLLLTLRDIPDAALQASEPTEGGKAVTP